MQINKFRLLLFAALFPAFVSAQQVSFTLSQDIPVSRDGKTLPLAFSGGLDAPQVNFMDVNADGREDAVLFDRSSFSLMVFLRGDTGYVFDPEMTAVFPEGIEHWMLLRDFNGDGRKDLFTSNPLGMIVYVNESDEAGIKWRLYHSREPGPSPLMTTGFNGSINLQLNATDLPSVGDVDGDGDVDILVFRFTGSSSVEWHRNMTLERTGTLDSMQFVRETQRWGDFEECECGEFAFGSEQCAPHSGKTLHEGGKSLLAIDMDGDGDQDAFISEESCVDLYLLDNEQGAMSGLVQTITENIPFPAAYYEDIDLDGLNDLVVGANIQSSSLIAADFSRSLRYYRNSGSNESPVFDGPAFPFLQDQMIDVGSGAAPVFFDADKDGDADLIIGNRYTFLEEVPAGSLTFYENTGNSTNPSYTWRDNDFLGLASLEMHNIQPRFSDINNDGSPDLVFLADDKEENRKLYVIEQDESGFTQAPYILFDQFFPFDSYDLSDADLDGTPDLIITRAAGRAEFYSGEYEGSSLQLTLESMDFLGITNNPLKSRGRLFLADINNNGFPDAIHTYGNGQIYWSPDISLTGSPAFTKLPLQGPSNIPSFGSYLWLEPFTYEGRISLMAGTGRGGLQILKGEIFPGQEGEFLIYPNPVTLSVREHINVRTDRPLQVSIFNLLGQEIRAFAVVMPGTHALAITGLNAGMYLLVGRQDGEVLVSGRIVVLD